MLVGTVISTRKYRARDRIHAQAQSPKITLLINLMIVIVNKCREVIKTARKYQIKTTLLCYFSLEIKITTTHF